VNNVLSWLKSAFSVQSLKGQEVNFNCPYCEHPRFYFNWKKKVGYCHRASCGRKPNLSDLVKLKGYGPSDYYIDQSIQEAEKPKKVELPPGLWDITENTDPWLVKALECRGIVKAKIDLIEIKGFTNRVYIPITYKSELVQFIGRAIDRSKEPVDGFKTDHSQRFKYASGSSVSKFIFNWDVSSTWEKLVLVESTFNAIAWNDKFNCTTNFGSHLSDIQINLLSHSNIKQVIFSWDKDAYKKAYAAAIKLGKVGIKTAILIYKNYNQPDEIQFDLLSHTINETFKELNKNAPHSFGPLRNTI